MASTILCGRFVCFRSASKIGQQFLFNGNLKRSTPKMERLLSTSDSGQKRPELKAKFLHDEVRMPPKQRLKNLFTIYGPTAVVLHIGLSLSFLGVTYLVVRYGFDVPAFLASTNLISENYMRIIASGGTFGLAYALYKSMMPGRVLVTLFLTPRVARKLKALGLIKREL